MNQNNQIQTKAQRIAQHEDEIELIDLLRVVWKWKYFIVAGIIICGIAAVVISLNMDKIYMVDMTIKPGILQVDNRGRNIYIDSPENIKALIESGIFNKQIINNLKISKVDKAKLKLGFIVNMLRNSDTIKVKYKTYDAGQGIDILNNLSQLLIQFYGQLVQNFINEYEMQLSSLKAEVDSRKNIIQSYKRNVENIDKRINELTLGVEQIRNNTNELISERKKLLLKNPREDNFQAALLYRNTIQKNLELSNNYQYELNECRLRKEEELQKIDSSESDVIMKLNEIDNLKFKKDNIQNIQILQSPSATSKPIKPNTKLNVMLSLAAGFFFFLFLSFFLEYLKRQQNDL